jgi:hypothetical protein
MLYMLYYVCEISNLEISAISINRDGGGRRAG